MTKAEIRAVLGPVAPEWMVETCPDVVTARRHAARLMNQAPSNTTAKVMERPAPGHKVAATNVRSTMPETVEVCMADVQPERVDWLWDGRIPRGAITLIDGDPGLGKSTLTIDVAARVTRGAPMPFDASQAGEPADVVLMTGEDDPAATIRPRLDAAGADARRVHVIKAMPRRGDPDAPPTLAPDDIARLERSVNRHRAVLVVIDPLMAYMPADIDAHRDTDVRRVLRVLAAMAQRTHAAIAVVRHLNKGAGSALYRGGGSIGIAGAARSVLLVGPEPKQDTDDGDEGVRVLASVKSNLAKLAPSLRWELADAPDHGAASIRWLEVAEGMTADRLTSPLPSGDGDGSKLDAAVSALQDVLASGPRPVREVERLVSELTGASKRTIERARAEAGVVAAHVHGSDGRVTGATLRLAAPAIAHEPRAPWRCGGVDAAIAGGDPLTLEVTHETGWGTPPCHTAANHTAAKPVVRRGGRFTVTSVIDGGEP